MSTTGFRKPIIARLGFLKRKRKLCHHHNSQVHRKDRAKFDGDWHCNVGLDEHMGFV